MDVVTFGETMVLLVPGSQNPLRFVEVFTKTIGGAESNVAIALSRLGHKVGWISKLGDDEFGLYTRNYIRGEGVDTSCVKFDPDYPTAVFFKEKKEGDPKVYYYRKGSAASYLNPTDIDESYLSQAKILHLTGITPALSDSCSQTVMHTIELAKKHNITIVFDPNIRLKLWTKEKAREVLGQIAPLCDIVLPGLDEGEILTGKSTPEEISQALLGDITHTVIIKLGEKGAYYQTKDESNYVSGFPVQKIVDTVGAGDGFAAGVISGILNGQSTEEAVRLGNRIGSYALTVAGDVEGYPYLDQLNKQDILR